MPPDTEILPRSDPAGAKIFTMRNDVRNGNMPTDEELRDLWRTAGGTLDAPTFVDGVATMRIDLLFPMLRTMFTVT